MSASPLVDFQDRFNIALRMTSGEDNIYKNLDIVSIKLYLNYVYNSNYNNITVTEVPLTVCTPDRFPNNPITFKNYKLDQSLCPDLSKKFIQGNFLSTDYYFYQIKFSICQNDPITRKSNDGSDIVCKNKSEIKNYFQNKLIKAHLFFTDTSYDEKNYTTPKKSFINNYNINIYYQSQRESHLYFSYSNLSSDDSYISLFPSSRFYSSITFSDLSERSAYRENYMNDLILINLRSDTENQIIQRSYKGFADIAANIGAMINIIFLLFNAILYLYSRIDFIFRLSKGSIFLYYNSPDKLVKKTRLNAYENTKKEVGEKSELGKSCEESKPNNVNTSNHQMLFLDTNVLRSTAQTNQLELISKKMIDHKKTINKEGSLENSFETISLLRSKNRSKFKDLLVLSFCPCFRHCSNKLRKNLYYLEIIQKHFFKYTDFFKFIKRFVEMNIIKKLILNKEEKEIINILKKIIVLKKGDMIFSFKHELNPNKTGIEIGSKLKLKNSLKSQEDKLKKYMNSLINKETKTTFERNLLEKFDDILKL